MANDRTTTRSTLSTAAVCAVAFAVVLASASCSNKEKKEAARPAQYVETTTTTAPATTSVAGGAAPVTAPPPSSPLSTDDIPGAEADNHDHIENEFGDLDGFEATIVTPADLNDPKAVALNFGCGYRAKPAGEGSDAWVARLAPLMTDRAATKMSALSSPPQPDSALVRPLGAVEIEPGTTDRGPKYRVNCDVKIVGAAGVVTGNGLIEPVTVILASSEAGWKVDDFSFGGIRFDG